MTSYCDSVFSIRLRMDAASLPKMSASPAARLSFVQDTGVVLLFTAWSISSGERIMVSALAEMASILPLAS